MGQFIDARELPPGSTLQTGVCIVGAGAAGITLARELAGAPFDVCLLESGGVDFEPATQALYRAENIGLPYFPLDANRQRSFGGTTNLWAGWCRPLDDVDFEPRSWVPHSGWPFSRAELLPYYRRAHELCGLGPLEYDPEYWLRRLGAEMLPLPAEQVVTRVYRLTTSTRFGRIFERDLRQAENLRLIHHANLLEIEATGSASSVTRLRVGCLSGNRFAVVARLYVLAMGGVENSRLLLLSRAVQPTGLGNAHDQLGRFFMDHLHFPAGAILLSNPRGTSTGFYAALRQRAVARLSLPHPVQQDEGLLGYSAMLQPIYRGDRSRLAAALSRLVGHGARWWFRREPLRSRIVRGLQDEGVSLYRFLPASRLGRALEGFRLHHTVEQAPNPESRISLGPDQDALGLNRVRLDWRASPLERLTFQRSLELLGEAFRDAGLGRLVLEPGERVEEWPPLPLQGMRGHHMGTTRMSREPQHGVVDAHCRVHGVENLFVAGSSVFPTAGVGTPTLTIIALALRLAGRVQTLMRNET